MKNLKLAIKMVLLKQPSKQKEQEIIGLLKSGDNRAYSYLYDDFYVPLCEVAFCYLEDKDLAEMMVEETITHIYEKRETLAIHPPIAPYLVTAVQNKCFDYLDLKRNKKERCFSSLETGETPCLDIPDTGENAHEMLEIKELENIIEKTVDQLPEECRAVFKKSRYEGKSYEEIAAELNITVNTVMYHIKKALAQLRKISGK
jgi:RNA polymerase sigma-70 factor (ECF subfamily)